MGGSGLSTAAVIAAALQPVMTAQKRAVRMVSFMVGWGFFAGVVRAGSWLRAVCKFLKRSMDDMIGMTHLADCDLFNGDSRKVCLHKYIVCFMKQREYVLQSKKIPCRRNGEALMIYRKENIGQVIIEPTHSAFRGRKKTN